jgi:hypothetical protein
MSIRAAGHGPVWHGMVEPDEPPGRATPVHRAWPTA